MICFPVIISSQYSLIDAWKKRKEVFQLTECLQQEFSETTFAFNCICLGAVQTEMLESAFPGYRAPMSPEGMAEYLFEFTSTGWKWFRGKILPASISTP